MRTIFVPDNVHQYLLGLAMDLNIEPEALAAELLTWTCRPGQVWREQAIEMISEHPIIEPDPDNAMAAATNSRKALDRAKPVGTLFIESFPQGPVRTLAQQINLLDKRVEAAIDRIETGMHEIQGLQQREGGIETMAQVGVALERRVEAIEALLANLGLSFAEYDQDH